MKEDVDELVKLYEEGDKTRSEAYELLIKLVPYRSTTGTDIPQIVKTEPFGLPAFVYPKPAPEHEDTVKLLETIKQFVPSWLKDVNVVLDRIGKTRYKMRFNDPAGRPRTGNIFREYTENEAELDNLLDDLDDHVIELRKIIFDYEESSERTVAKTDDVEPATYDPKTRTIFFADEAIRFNTNAEYSPAICKLMFETPDQLWQLKDFQSVWDSLYDYLDIAKPTDWNRVYDTIKKMNTRIEKATGIPNLFKLTTKSVRLNPKFIAPTEK
jgi:hypothetical protein